MPTWPVSELGWMPVLAFRSNWSRMHNALSLYTLISIILSWQDPCIQIIAWFHFHGGYRLSLYKIKKYYYYFHIFLNKKHFKNNRHTLALNDIKKPFWIWISSCCSF
jgi:hypothetical protein